MQEPPVPLVAAFLYRARVPSVLVTRLDHLMALVLQVMVR